MTNDNNNPQNNDKIKIKLERHKWPDEIAKEKRKKNRIITVAITIAVTFALGWTFGSAFYAPAGTIAKDANVARFERVYDRLLKNWYFVNDIENPSEKLIENAINGMIQLNGDQHTSYMTAEESQKFAESIDMTFVGIGVQYNVTEKLITRVFKESPADKAGIMAGDVITSVDGTKMIDMEPNADLKELIMGEEGTIVKIGIDRLGKAMDFEVTRGSIDALTWGEMIDKETAYLEISSFGRNLGQRTEAYLKDFNEQGAKYLILDLRDNGGGYLDAINDLANLFFENGETVYFEEFTDGREVEYKVKNSVAKNYKFDNIVILINEQSASASEVFALAMRDNLETSLIGTKSYGKGTVQTQVQDGVDKSFLKYTFAKWYSPTKVNIHQIGIEPDHEVRLSDIFYTQFVELKDGATIKYDSVHPGTAYIQRGLKFLGYHTGRIDSYYDSATRDAIYRYQKAMNLKQTDVIDQDLINKVYGSVLNEWTKNQKQHDVQLHKAIEVVKK